jgi:hypothetical protein
MRKFWRRDGVTRDASGSSSEQPVTAEDRADFLDTHPDVVHADLEQLDAETRAMYRDARAAAKEDAESQGSSQHQVREFVVRSPFQLGFVVTLGALVAILFGQMIGQLSTIIMYVVGGLFIALALDPLVRWLERRKVKRQIGRAHV